MINRTKCCYQHVLFILIILIIKIWKISDSDFDMAQESNYLIFFKYVHWQRNFLNIYIIDKTEQLKFIKKFKMKF